RTKGRPSGALNHHKDNSTQRDPSGFELVDHKAKLCSICRQPGHNVRTCTNNSV
ncbi:19940_t:CDS:1, partial [Dentiscutata erythropus]